MNQFSNKIFNAIKAGLNNALVIDSDDSSISYTTSSVNNNISIYTNYMPLIIDCGRAWSNPDSCTAPDTYDVLDAYQKINKYYNSSHQRYSVKDEKEYEYIIKGLNILLHKLSQNLPNASNYFINYDWLDISNIVYISFISETGQEIDIDGNLSNAAFIKLTNNNLKGNEIYIHKYRPSIFGELMKWQTECASGSLYKVSGMYEMTKNQYPDKETALMDFNGYQNTQEILMNFPGYKKDDISITNNNARFPRNMAYKKVPAAYQASKQVVKYKGKNVYGYLPALGQLYYIKIIADYLNYYLQKMLDGNGKILKIGLRDDMWSSTESNDLHAWYISGCPSNYYTKESTMEILPIFKLD